MRVLDAQPGLFDRSRTLERTLPSGATVRLRLEPLEHHLVRIVEYRRRSRDGARWERRGGEEGRTYAYARLGLGLTFDHVFG